MKGIRNVAIFIPHLGCPYRCSFCQQQRISAVQSPPSPESVGRTVQTHLATIPPETQTEIAFFGGTFTLIPPRLQEAYLIGVQPFLESGQVDGIRISTRPDAIEEEHLRRLRKWGVTTVELGVQSLDAEVLRRSHRGYQPAQVFSACTMIRQMGLRLGIQLMIGLPGDNKMKDLATALQVIDLQPDMVRIYPTLVIAGTELEQAYQAGIYRPLPLSEAVDITEALYARFLLARIPVIRMGLHPGEDLQQPDTVIAGPFHPAFGELVLQLLARNQARVLIRQFQGCHSGVSDATLLCAPRELSQLVGPQRGNLALLKTEFGLRRLEARSEATLPAGCLGIAPDHTAGPEMRLERERYLRMIL